MSAETTAGDFTVSSAELEKLMKEQTQIVSEGTAWTLTEKNPRGSSVFRDLFLNGSAGIPYPPLFQPTTPPPGVTGVSINAGSISQQLIRTTMLETSDSAALVIKTDKGDIRIGRDGSITWPGSLDEAAQKFVMTIHTQMGEYFKPFIQKELRRIATKAIHDLDHKDDEALSMYERATLAAAVEIKLAEYGYGKP